MGARQKDAGRAVTTRAFRERDDATRSTAYHRGGDLKEMVVNKTRNVVISSDYECELDDTKPFSFPRYLCSHILFSNRSSRLPVSLCASVTTPHATTTVTKKFRCRWDSARHHYLKASSWLVLFFHYFKQASSQTHMHALSSNTCSRASPN